MLEDLLIVLRNCENDLGTYEGGLFDLGPPCQEPNPIKNRTPPGPLADKLVL